MKAFTLLILLFALTISGQNTTPKQPEPNVKVVVEKTNGDRLTGEFISASNTSISIEVSGTKINILLSEIALLRFNSATQSETTAVVETSLSFEAALIYNYGGTQPVGRTSVYLLDKPLRDILTEAGLAGERNLSVVSTFGL